MNFIKFLELGKIHPTGKVTVGKNVVVGKVEFQKVKSFDISDKKSKLGRMYEE